MAYLHSGNMIRWLHVLWLSSCYFISMQDSHYLNNVIKFMFSKEITSAAADMTDLGTNDEWNGKCEEEDSGDNDVNGALRPSSLQWTSKSMTHCYKQRQVPDNPPVVKPCSLIKEQGCWSRRIQTLRKERSDNHIFMFWTFFSLKWGISDFLALRAEVRWLKYLANKSLCWGNMDIHCQRCKALDRM